MTQNKVSAISSKPDKSLPGLNFTLSPEIPQISPRTAPNSPNKTSPTNGDLFPSERKSTPSSTPGRPYLPLRANTESFDPQKIEHESLFSHRAHTDPIETERQESSRQEKGENEDMKSKPSLRSLQNLIDDMKSNGNRSHSAKPSKSPKGTSATPVKWPETLSNSIGGNKKSSNKTRKRPLSTKERPVDSSLSRDSMNKSERKAMKTVIKDLEIELGIDEKYNTEGDGPDGLFEEDLSDRKAESCKHSRDTGPIRYSKMSEEDAATMFEIRRRELLNFLVQLGANSALVKRKLAYRKPGILKHGQSPEGSRKHDFEKERGMRSVKEAFNDSVSPQKFIIYNSNTDTMWNGNQQIKTGTPAKEKDNKKRQVDSLKIGNDSTSDLKRRNSVKNIREREEQHTNNVVQRNLEASFNKIASDWQETLLAKTRSKSKSRTEKQVKSPDERHKEAYESIKIDLKKVVSRKKKQKKVEKEEEKPIPVIETVVSKKQSEDMNTKIDPRRRVESVVVENGEVNRQLIEKMRKKNQTVLSQIEEIDLQIRKMKTDGERKTPKSAVEDTRFRKKSKEKSREVYDESLEEGYAQAARLKKIKERSRSMGFRNSFFEAMKQQQQQQEHESLWDENSPKSRRNHTTERQRREKSKNNVNENKSAVQISNKNEQDRRPRSPLSAIEKQKGNWSVSNADVKKEKPIQNNKRFPENELKIPKAGSPISSFSTNNTPLQPKKDVFANTKQSMDLGKKLLTLDQSPSMGFLPNTASKAIGKGKDTSNFNGGESGQKQQAKQQVNERTLKKTPHPVSTLQTSRQAPTSGFTSPKEPSSAVVKSVTNVDSVQNKRQGFGSPDNKKILFDSKKSSISSLHGKKGKLSIDKDLRSDNSDQLEYLDRQHINFQDNAKSPTKTSFCDEVKKILREGNKEERKTPTNYKGKSASTAKEHTRTLTGAPKVTKDVFNRPNAELSPSMALRAKVYREGRPAEEIGKGFKLNLPPNSLLKAKGRDLKYVVDDFSQSGTKTKWQQHMKGSLKDEDLFRRGSEAINSNFDGLAASDTFNVYASNTMQELGTDRRGYSDAQKGAGALGGSESIESFKLKEKYAELVGQVSKVTKQLENMKDQNKTLKKDIMQNIRKKKI